MSRPEPDTESKALASSPEFQGLIAAGRASKGKGVSADELDRRRPVAPLEQEYADAYLNALELLENAQDGEVTDEQGRLLKVILTARDLAEERAPLSQLVEASGVPAPALRAAAAALRSLRERVPARAG
jgi:hypothetical protein